MYRGSRADDRYYIQRDFPVRENMVPGQQNIMQEQLAYRDKILLPPLHIKFYLMKNLIKTLDIEVYAFQFIRNKCPHISNAKINAGILNGPQIR